MSRTSGNSGTAQMKDLVGPGSLSNDCGAIKITKKSSKDDSALAGATFTIEDANGDEITGSPFTTDANGEVCVDHLPFGDYTMTETAAPPGYDIDDETAHSVTVDNVAFCADDPFVGETTGLPFSDTPLAEIEAIFRFLAQDADGTDLTAPSVVCEDATPATVDPVSENGDPDPGVRRHRRDDHESRTGYLHLHGGGRSVDDTAT